MVMIAHFVLTQHVMRVMTSQHLNATVVIQAELVYVLLDSTTRLTPIYVPHVTQPVMNVTSPQSIDVPNVLQEDSCRQMQHSVTCSVLLVMMKAVKHVHLTLPLLFG